MYIRNILSYLTTEQSNRIDITFIGQFKYVIFIFIIYNIYIRKNNYFILRNINHNYFKILKQIIIFEQNSTQNSKLSAKRVNNKNTVERPTVLVFLYFFITNKYNILKLLN
jgi:hypothetical protein